MKNLTLHSVDLYVILGYFALIFAVGIYFIVKANKDRSASENYFLGGRNLGWFAIGASLFASNIGSEHLVGLAGAGAAGEFPAAQIEILAALMLLLLGWLFVPFYLRTQVYTMPEFLEVRYDRWARGYLSWVSVVAYVLTKISITIIAGGIVLTSVLDVNFWTAAVIIVLITGLYTVLGGLKAVVYTDVIQLFVLLGGSITLTIYGLNAAGGWSEVTAATESTYTSLWRSVSDDSFPWTGILLGAPILGVWYWCTDQFIVQRVLAAKNIDQARRGSIFAGFLKLSPLFIFVIPGVIAYVLSVGQDPILAFPVQDGKVVYDAALPTLTMAVLPVGLRGLVVAGLIAALMSSLSSVFNSCSTLFTMDIYKRYRPDAEDKKLVRVGQVATVVLVIFGMAWVPVLQSLDGGLFEKLQSLQAYIAPPVAAVFLIGILNKKVNANGAKYALVVGAALGLLRLTLEALGVEATGVLGVFIDMNFLHFAVFLFVVCVLILFGVSMRSSIGSFQWKIADESVVAAQPSSLNKVLSVALILSILILWYVFK